MAARSERDDLAHPTSPHPGARNRHRHCRPLPGPDQPRQPRRRAPAAEPRSRPRTRKQRLRTPLLPHDEARLPDHGQHQRDQNLCGPSRPSLPSSRRTRPGPYPGRSGSRPGHLGDAAGAGPQEAVPGPLPGADLRRQVRAVSRDTGVVRPETAPGTTERTLYRQVIRGKRQFGIMPGATAALLHWSSRPHTADQLVPLRTTRPS